MQSMNFVVLGDQSIASNFGKKGTQTDLTLYDKKESDTVRTWVAPTGFPEKIQPLFQAINLSEFAILPVTTLDKFVGEQIVALDILGKKLGVISHSFDVDENTLHAMIKDTVVDNYTVTEPDNLRETIAKIKPESKNEGNDTKTKIVIDHCFDVKGVGTVVLGKVTSGTVKQYDNLKLLPAGVDVMVKSIQMHDDPSPQAVYPARVGLSLKGVKPDEVNRGDILCLDNDDSVTVTDKLELDFTKTIYYKGDIAENQMCLVSVGLKIMAGKFLSVADTVKIKLDKPIAHHTGDVGVVLKPESSSIRILGSGKIK